MDHNINGLPLQLSLATALVAVVLIVVLSAGYAAAERAELGARPTSELDK